MLAKSASALVLCSSTQRTAGAPKAQPTGKPSVVPRLAKQLGAGLAGVLSAACAASPAGAAASDPIPFGASSLPSVSLPDVDMPDMSSLLDGSVDPLLLGGGLAAVAIPAALVALLGGGGPKGPKAKPVPAQRALEALAADDTCLLLDIRSKAEIRANGAPNLKGISRRAPTSVPYVITFKGEDQLDAEFVSKVGKVKGVSLEGGPVILIDSDGSLCPSASKEILAELPLEKLYYVQGGADAWQAAGGPWKDPSKGLPFELPDLSESLQSLSSVAAEGVRGLKEAPEATKNVLVVGALVGASALLFTQLEILFELAGVLAAGQFLLKVAFAEEREKTLTEIKKVVDEVDVADLPADLSKITSALLEDPSASGTEVRRAQAAAKAALAASASTNAAAKAPEPAPAPTPAPITPPAAAAGATTSDNGGSGSGSSGSGSEKVADVSA